MKRLMLLGALALMATASVPAFAQGNDEAMKAKKAKKLAAGWVTNNPWVQDYDAAMAKAEESNKLIFGYFTRSYAP